MDRAVTEVAACSFFLKESYLPNIMLYLEEGPMEVAPACFEARTFPAYLECYPLVSKEGGILAG